MRQQGGDLPEEVFTACGPRVSTRGRGCAGTVQPAAGAGGPGLLPGPAGQGRGGSGNGVVNSVNHWPGASCTAPMRPVTWSTGRS